MIAALALSVVLAQAPASSADTLLQLSQALLEQASELKALARGYADSNQSDASDAASQLFITATDTSNAVADVDMWESTREAMVCEADRKTLAKATQLQVRQVLRGVQFRMNTIDQLVPVWQRLQQVQQRDGGGRLQGALDGAQHLRKTLQTVQVTLQRMKQ
ncbi:MAG: hypothetical protein DMF84_26760 [Acidobacteria bacterium]|nr:MAG: hypothetical protein DMF84_26760 [Acidobacteriota bacterium]